MPKNIEIVIALENIRSVHNVGSIFRTADGFGVKKILLGKETPAPIDRFGRKRQDFAKVALGAENRIPYEFVDDFVFKLNNLKKEGYQIVIIEQSNNSIALSELKISNTKVVLVLGNEVTGVKKEILSLADNTYELEMQGSKESFNVSIMAGIALYQIIYFG